MNIVHRITNGVSHTHTHLHADLLSQTPNLDIENLDAFIHFTAYVCTIHWQCAALSSARVCFNDAAACAYDAAIYIGFYTYPV